MGDRSSRDCFTCFRRSAKVMALAGFGRSAWTFWTEAQVEGDAVAALVDLPVELLGRAHAGATPATAIRARLRIAMTSLRACVCTAYPMCFCCEGCDAVILGLSACG